MRKFVRFVLPVALLAAVGCAGAPGENMTQSGTTAEPAAVAAESSETGEVTTVSSESPADGGPFEATSSGLKYRILREGSGASPKASDTVVCHYRGWLDDGTEFDSSYKRGEPATFPLNQVIPGWTEGLQLVKQGGKIELEIPSDLGYGPRGAPPVIPPNARLHFEVELVQIR